MYKRNKLTRRSKLSKRTSKRRHTRKNNRRHTRCTRKSKGGNYMQQTKMTLEGIPLEKDAVVDVAGFGTMSVKEYVKYINNQDLHPRP